MHLVCEINKAKEYTFTLLAKTFLPCRHDKRKIIIFLRQHLLFKRNAVHGRVVQNICDRNIVAANLKCFAEDRSSFALRFVDNS